MPKPMPRAPPVTSATLFPIFDPPFECVLALEERVVTSLGHPRSQQRRLQQMIVAPHARLAAGNLAARGNRVPAVGPVIDAVQQDPLVLRIGGKLRVLMKPTQYRQVCVCVGRDVMTQRVPLT